MRNKITLVACATHKDKLLSIAKAHGNLDIHNMYESWFIEETNVYTTYNYDTGTYDTFIENTFTQHKPSR